MGSVDRVKHRTKYRKKRRGFCRKDKDECSYVNTGIQVDVNNVNIVNMESNILPLRLMKIKMAILLHLLWVADKPTTLSSDKIETIDAETPKSSDEITGYRIIDTEILFKVFQLVLCPDCYKPSLKFRDRLSKKMGRSYLLYLECLNCGYLHEFYTSGSTGKGFDVNTRMVYDMRSMGQDHAGLEKYTSLMSMPTPVTQKYYDKLV